MDTVGVQQAKAKEAARNNDNEFNIRKKFLNNSVGAIREASYSQFNIVICTDQEHDDFQNLQGRILPMDLIDVEVSQGKIVNFQVYVFDTGKYLRHGKWERDHWCWWGETNKWHDPFAMHVHFENAQAKLDANQIKQQQDAQAAKNTTARTVATAVDKTLVQESHSNAQGLQIDAQSRAQDPSYIYGAEPGQTAAAGSHAPIAPMSFTTSKYLQQAFSTCFKTNARFTVVDL